jgi:hypothetical protein
MITFVMNCKVLAGRRQNCQVYAGRSSKFCKVFLGRDSFIVLIFNDYFFLFFRKTVRIFALEFYADRDRTKVDKQDTLNKPQIVPHKAEATTYLTVFQTNKKSNKSPRRGHAPSGGWRGNNTKSKI